MLLKSSFFSVFSSVVQFVVSIGSGVIIARTLGPVGKGQVFLVVQMAGLGSMIFSLGLGNSYLFHLRKGLITGKEAMGHATFLLSVVALACLLVYLWGLPLLGFLTGKELPDVLLAGMLLMIVLNISTQYSGGILMHDPKGIQWISTFGVIGGVGYILVLLTLVWYFRLGSLGAVSAALAPLVIRQLLTGWFLFGRMQLPFTFGGLHWTKPLVAYGLASFTGNLMLTTACRVDTFLINALIGPAPLGVYSVAVNMAELTLMVPAAVGVALFPHLTSQKDADRVATSSLVARLSLCLGLISAIGVGIFGYPVIALIFGQRFIGAYQPLLALLPGLVAMTTAYGYANYFASLGRPLVNAAVFGVGVVVNVGLNLLVISRFGIVGAAAVTSCSYLVSMALFIILISRMAVVPWQSLVLPRRSDLMLIIDKIRPLLLRLRPDRATSHV